MTFGFLEAPSESQSVNLNYNHLFYFYTAVNKGSLKGAAEALRLSPSTISEQISELETFFGKTLLRRQKGKLALTDHGQTAYQFSRTIFTAGDRLRNTLKDNRESHGTPIEIGVNSSVTELFERDLFMPLLKDEEARVRLRVGELMSLADDLYSYSLDVVLTEREIKEVKGVKCEIVQKPSYSVVASPQLKIKPGAKFPADFKKVPFIHYTVFSGVKWEIDQFFMEQEIKPSLVGEVDDTGIMKHAVQDGLCYAILPTAIVQKELKSGDLISYGVVPEINVKVFAYYHEKQPSKHLKAIINYLRETKI